MVSCGCLQVERLDAACWDGAQDMSGLCAAAERAVAEQDKVVAAGIAELAGQHLLGIAQVHVPPSSSPQPC